MSTGMVVSGRGDGDVDGAAGGRWGRQERNKTEVRRRPTRTNGERLETRWRRSDYGYENLV
jgi:hypothetical protein